MLWGCVTFAFASGSLASIIQQYDDNMKIYEEQLDLLNKIFKEYKLPVELYARIKN